jgi:quinol monooxygenase YgiN
MDPSRATPALARSAMLLTARFTARPAGRRELARALLDWATAARREAGLRATRVYEDVESPGTFGLVAEWESRDRLEAHLRSEPFSVLKGAVEMLAEASQVEVTRADHEAAAWATRNS